MPIARGDTVWAGAAVGDKIVAGIAIGDTIVFRSGPPPVSYEQTLSLEYPGGSIGGNRTFSLSGERLAQDRRYRVNIEVSWTRPWRLYSWRLSASVPNGGGTLIDESASRDTQASRSFRGMIDTNRIGIFGTRIRVDLRNFVAIGAPSRGVFWTVNVRASALDIT